MTKTAINPIAYNTDQSWNYQVHFLTGNGVMLRISIRRNAYDNQSHARVEAFDGAGLKWNPLGSIPFETCACKTISYVQKQLTGSDMVLFEQDADRLLQMALVILQDSAAKRIPLSA